MNFVLIHLRFLVFLYILCIKISFNFHQQERHQQYHIVTKNRFSIQPIDRPFAYTYTHFMIYYRILSSIFSNHIHACLLSKSKGFLVIVNLFCVYVHKLCERWMSNNVLQRNFWSLLPFFIRIIMIFFPHIMTCETNERTKAIYGKVIE